VIGILKRISYFIVVPLLIVFEEVPRYILTGSTDNSLAERYMNWVDK
jgi:hypothetical protein